MSIFDHPENVSRIPVVANDRVNNNVAALVQLADGEISANKPTSSGASSVLADCSRGVQPHGKKG